MYHTEGAFRMLGKAQSKCSVEKNENCIKNDLHFLISHSQSPAVVLLKKSFGLWDRPRNTCR
jgi:hypothetical protein